MRSICINSLYVHKYMYVCYRLSTYDSTYLIAQEIAEKIQERNRCQRNGESTAKVLKYIFSLSFSSVIFKIWQEHLLSLYHLSARFSQVSFAEEAFVLNQKLLTTHFSCTVQIVVCDETYFSIDKYCHEENFPCLHVIVHFKAFVQHASGK